MKRLLLLVILVVVAVGIGLWLGSGPRVPTTYDLQRDSVNLEFARTMLPFRVAFRVLLGAVSAATLGGLGWGVVRWLLRRADTIYPDSAGLYPIREGQLGRAKLFHDPNRTPTGTTVYAKDPSAVGIRQPLPAGQVSLQQQITAQAQAAQALRAAVSGNAPLPGGQPLPLDLAGRPCVSRPLPEVRSLEVKASHVERLLLEDGEHAT